VGVEEAREVARGLASQLSKGGAKVHCSAMRRAVHTALPIAEALGVGCTVLPDVFEIGGIYGLPDGETGVFAPGRGYSAAEISALHPIIDASLLPEEGVWDRGPAMSHH
ncbi:hypothetical protein T484DRAFT_1838083, partial [Baffinella frigidus]